MVIRMKKAGRELFRKHGEVGEMAEKPIIFSTEMVSAILDERKSMTRRVIRPQPYMITEGPTPQGSNWMAWYADGKCSDLWPKHKIGDILWVRETWGIATTGDIIYKADYVDKKAPLAEGAKWRPSIHMPKEVARIFLEVTNVRPERLQDITEEDALREGVHPWGLETQQRMDKWCRYTLITDPGRTTGTFRGEFAAFWDHLNAKRGYGWKENPWVWVIEFRKEVIKHD